MGSAVVAAVALRRRRAWAARASGPVRRLPAYLRSASGTQATNSLSPASGTASCTQAHPALPPGTPHHAFLVLHVPVQHPW